MNLLEHLTPEALALDQVARGVAACPAFQTACQVASAEEATPFVHREAWFVPGEDVTQPFAAIWPPAGGGVQIEKLSDGTWMPSGSMSLQIGQPILDPDNLEQSGNDFRNLHGQIIEWLTQEPNKEGGYILTPRQIVGQAFTTDAELEALEGKVPFWSVLYSIDWGPFG